MDPSGFIIGTIARAVPILLFFSTYFSFQQFFFSDPFFLSILLESFIPVSETCVIAILEYFITDDCSIRVS